MPPVRKARPEIEIGGRNKAEKDKAADELAHSSYPSGHASFGILCAILLADMVPEKREALVARGRDYAHSRLVVGAHFPTDVEAGRIAGTVAAALLWQNANFRRDLAEARTTLRTALGLSPQPPDLEPHAMDGAQGYRE
jgi:membrane-associated phospholipid phosphatase